MGPYFHARWYVDADGLLQRRTAIEQQRYEDYQLEREADRAAIAAPLAGQRTTDGEGR